MDYNVWTLLEAFINNKSAELNEIYDGGPAVFWPFLMQTYFTFQNELSSLKSTIPQCKKIQYIYKTQ